MKWSRYIIVTDVFDAYKLAYNTLTDSLTLLSGKLVNSNKLSETEKQILYAQGCIVNDAIDELEICRFRNRRQRFCDSQTHIFLTTTNLCNCACKYCFADGVFPEHSMSIADLDIIENFVKKQLVINHSNKLCVDFFGGEPFLNEAFYTNVIERLNNIAQKSNITFYYQFYTNGTITPKVGFNFFKKYPNCNFIVTIDGTKSVHDNLRPLKNKNSAFDEIVRNTKNLLDLGLNVTFRVNFGLDNYLSVSDLFEQLHSLNLSNVPIDFIPVQHLTKECASYDKAVPPEKLYDMNKYLWGKALEYNVKINVRPRSSNVYCSAFCYSTFIIDPDLDVFKCAILQCDKKYKIGNLKSYNPTESNSEYYRWMNYDPTLHPQCSKCPSLPACAGGCAGSGTFRHGDYTLPNCYENTPKILKLRIKTYFEYKYKKQVEKYLEANKQEALILEKARFMYV